MGIIFKAAALLPAIAGICAQQPPPHTHACLPPNDGFPFCDTSRTVPERVAWLVGNLTLAEKISLMQDGQPAVDRLGLPFFNYNLESLHGLGSKCLGERCPTIFPAPPTLGSAFNTSLMTAMGICISDEIRAMNNNNGTRQWSNRPVDLNTWLPSINLNINVLWGRNIEVYGEDPLLAGRLAAHLVKAVQWGNGTSAPGQGFLKVIGTTKHYSYYQVETNRFAFNAANVTAHDSAMTYLLPWQILAAEGGNAGAMCSYPAVNGIPMCANGDLINNVLRDTFGMGIEGGSYVQGDCGAIDFIYSAHGYASNYPEAAAYALNAGVDIDCGDTYTTYLGAAITQGLTNETMLDESLTRTFTLHFLAGRFDPLDGQPYTRIPIEKLGSPEHAALSFDAALQGMVLLRNDAGVLPLKQGQRIAVVGPHGNSTGDLAGNYFEWLCPGGPDDASCVPSIFDAISAVNGAASVSFAQGCDMVNPAVQNITAAVQAASAADVVVLALGINSQVAQEGQDRENIALPGAQAQLAAAILALKKPTVVLLVTGAQLGIDDIVMNTQTPLAIVNLGAPGNQGGTPVAQQLFGAANRWGKLSYTMYPNNITSILDPFDYSMTKAPGRTYKYYTGPVLYPFGFGLSYTTFNVSLNNAGSQALHLTDVANSVDLTFTVTNTGSRNGDEVVFAFIKPQANVKANVPGGNDTMAKQILADFARVNLNVGTSTQVTFTLSALNMASYTIDGDAVLASGDYEVEITNRHSSVSALLRVDLGRPYVTTMKFPAAARA